MGLRIRKNWVCYPKWENGMNTKRSMKWKLEFYTGYVGSKDLELYVTIVRKPDNLYTYVYPYISMR